MYLCDQILDELNDVVKRKAPHALSALSKFIDDLDFIKAPEADLGLVTIGDINDQPILNTAIAADVGSSLLIYLHLIKLLIRAPAITRCIDLYNCAVINYNYSTIVKERV